MGKKAKTSDQSKRKSKDKSGATVNARLRKDRSNHMLVRLKTQAMPHYVLAGLAAGGTVASWIGPAVATPGAAGATVAAAGAAGAWLWARRRGWRALLAGLGAACWCGWVTAAGMSWDAAAILAVGGYGAALPHWRRHRLPDPPEHHLPETPEVDTLDPAHLWQEHIACQGGPLPGTTLTAQDKINTGVRYDLLLVPGKQALTDVRATVAKLRSGLRLRPEQDLVIEQHPTADEATVRVTLVQRSPVLTTAQPWPGNTYDPQSGTVELGPYVDGEGVATWLVHRDNGLYGGFLTGATRSGKSRMMEAIALGAATAGCTVWFADPQAGASSPFLADHADWTARDVDQVRVMLEAAQRVKELRQAQNGLERWEGWNPQQGRPGLLLIIDECHRVFEDTRCQALATELAREGGKCGVALVAASQVATLDVWGPGTGGEALRSSVRSGNEVLLRTKANSTKMVMNVDGVDPTAFPRIPGYAFLLDDTGDRRTAPFRGFYLDDQTRDRAAQEVHWPELDPAAAAAAGTSYRQRHDQAATAQQALVAKIAALTGQAPAAPLPAPAPTTPSAPAVPVPRFPGLPTSQTTSAATAVLDRPEPTTAADAVARLLREGVTSPGEIQQRSGYGETAVRQALRELAQQGRARRVRHGVWTTTPTT